MLMDWKVAVKVRRILTLAWAVLGVYCIWLVLDLSKYRLRSPGTCSLASRHMFLESAVSLTQAVLQ
jgi:hypothetical protein